MAACLEWLTLLRRKDKLTAACLKRQIKEIWQYIEYQNWKFWRIRMKYFTCWRTEKCWLMQLFFPHYSEKLCLILFQDFTMMIRTYLATFWRFYVLIFTPILLIPVLMHGLSTEKTYPDNDGDKGNTIYEPMVCAYVLLLVSSISSHISFFPMRKWFSQMV